MDRLEYYASMVLVAVLSVVLYTILLLWREGVAEKHRPPLLIGSGSFYERVRAMRKQIEQAIEALSGVSNVGIFVLMFFGAIVGGVAHWVHMDAEISDLKSTVVQQGQETGRQVDQVQQEITGQSATLANHEGRIETLERTIPVMVRSWPKPDPR